MTTADAFLALATEFQTLIDKAFDSVADQEPLLKKQKFLGAGGGDSVLNEDSLRKQDSISASSVLQAFLALRKTPILPDDDEFFTRFEHAFDLEKSGDSRITRDTWRRVCAFFIEEQQRRAEPQKSSDVAEEEVQLDLNDEEKNLVEELLRTRDDKTLPSIPALDDLNITSLVVVVKAYIDKYPYDKKFARFWPKKLTPSGNPSVPTDSERKRFRFTLKAFVDFPRSALRELDSNIDPDNAQRDFIMKEIISRRGDLEVVGSIHWTLLKQSMSGVVLYSCADFL